MTIFDYTVNYVDAGIVAFILVFALIGYRRGILMTMMNFIRYSLGITLCFYVSSAFSQAAYEAYVRPKCLEIIETQIVTGNMDETLANLHKFSESLPSFLAGFMKVDSIDVSAKDMAQSILTNVFEPVAITITKVLLFVAVFILFFGITGIIFSVVKHNRKKKERREGKTPLRMTDKLLGFAFGLLKSGVVVLAFVSILMYVLNLDDNMAEKNAFLTEAANSSLIKYINDINPFNAITEGLL